MRRPLVAGNWKMHGSRESVRELLQGLLDGVSEGPTEVAVCPTFVHLAQALEACDGSALAVGAQDCSHLQSGACTGDIAPAMLADLGCDWVILGHSERRAFHAESDELISSKLVAAVEAGLKPILCVGETREQREAGDAETVVAGQLRGALQGIEIPANLVVAYEPVWAIGTGLTATPEQAQAMHGFIRGELAAVGVADASQTRLLYGGSVKPGNAAELFAQPDIDGALVGGAALVAADFLAIVAAAA
ncbi:triose-phosphate isomerase [Mangrovimicrobium sediminis]|uniref:Triosephosphate isomerase n=1 Tax=Mangrovimicrobium sediminis TaxID=2562682 RepID=A0A4Z0LV02_9GAMM|nr:triose-phosphate isomerase [Haliea sp. SAOS-164]TGD70958.1 triose-phosphate isomerase [Haliea sp. SAOS-164]